MEVELVELYAHNTLGTLGAHRPCVSRCTTHSTIAHCTCRIGSQRTWRRIMQGSDGEGRITWCPWSAGQAGRPSAAQQALLAWLAWLALDTSCTRRPCRSSLARLPLRVHSHQPAQSIAPSTSTGPNSDVWRTIVPFFPVLPIGPVTPFFPCTPRWPGLPSSPSWPVRPRWPA